MTPSPPVSATAGTAVPGDDTGIVLPVGPEELLNCGSGFLTRALRKYGTLAADDAVAHITDFAEVGGGSTGRKARLSVEYAGRDPQLPTELFVKFSRDLDDPVRDAGRTQMKAEVRLAGLARTPGFPITVPATLFADYHSDSGTGLLISERIMFGDKGIEPQHHKCLDYEMPDPLDHYRTMTVSLARLAGWHRSGAAGDAIDAFPVDLQAANVGERRPLSENRLARQLERLAEFTSTHPGLFPAEVRASHFLSDFAEQVPVIVQAEAAVWRHLAADPNHIALCHWNANVDNAWFWRDADDVLQCGLMDWGCVSQMNVAMALWGAMSAAEITLWNEHFDALVTLFVTELVAAGGPPIDPGELTRHVLIYAGIMGVSWLLDVPALIASRLGEAARTMTRYDAPIKHDESVRAPLQMLVNVLNLWQTRDVGALLTGL
ncbi:MAG: hypothetical protein M3Y90_08380 [Actinomycetota bacterium]|nr:hypothetical protein [Actinomycetota bacterium]